MDISLASGLGSAFSGLVQANASNKAAVYQAQGANTIRAGNNKVTGIVNERNASITALQRWRQTVSNSRVYEAVAANQEALATNFNRSRDQRTRANFSTSIKQAEESGRQQAMAAASGVTGSVVDVIDRTTRMRQGMENTANVETERYISSDYTKREFAQKWATLDSLDYSIIFDNTQVLDYGNNVASKTSLLGAALGGKDTIQNLVNGVSNFSFNTPPERALWDSVDYQQRGDN